MSKTIEVYCLIIQIILLISYTAILTFFVCFYDKGIGLKHEF